MQPIHSHIRLIALALAAGTILFGLTAAATLARPLARLNTAPLAAGSASIRLAGPGAAVPPGQSFSVPLEATALDNPLSAFQVDVTFDPTILTFNGIATGPLLGSSGRAIVCPPAVSSPGRVRFVCTSAGEATGASSPGLLATLHFSAHSPGSSSLALEGVQLVDGGRPPALFSVNSQNSEVTVAGPAATPTVTATPTATPTATATPDSFDLFLPNVEMNSQSSRGSAPQNDEWLFLPAVGR